MNNPFGSSSGGGFGASRSMQQGFGSQQQQAPQQQGFGSQQQGFGGFGGQQQGFGGFGGFGGQQMQNPFQQAPQQQSFGGYGGQQQSFGGYGGQQQGFGGYGGQQQYNPYQQQQQQQYNPYQQMQQPQQQYGGFDPRAMSANPSGFQQWMEGARQQETQRPGSTMMSQQQYNPYQQQMPQQGYGGRGGRGYGRQQAEMGMRQQQAEMGMRQQQADMARSQMALKMQEQQPQTAPAPDNAQFQPGLRAQPAMVGPQPNFRYGDVGNSGGGGYGGGGAA